MIDFGKLARVIMVNIIMGFLYPEYAAGQINGVYTDSNGQTVEVDKSVHEIITTNQPEVLYFSNGLRVKVDTNSDLLINSFFQDVSTNSCPEVLKAQESSFEATLNKGDAWVVYDGSTNENSSCIISTPLADHELSKGSYYFQIDNNKDIVVTMDGSSKTTENSSTALASKGNATIVVQENDNGIIASKESIYVDNVKAAELQKLSNEANLTDQFIFIRIDGKTVAVLL